MNLDNLGIKTRAYIDDSGQVVVDFTTDRALLVNVNGQRLSVSAVSKSIPRQTFWNPDGTQTNVGTVDLRGELK